MNTRNKIILTMLVTSGIISAAGVFYHNQINMRSSIQNYMDIPVTVFPDEFQEKAPVVLLDKKNSDKKLSKIYAPRENEPYSSLDDKKGTLFKKQQVNYRDSLEVSN